MISQRLLVKGVALLQLLLVVCLCNARKVLPPEAYKNRTLYPVIPVYHQRPLLSIGLLSDIQYANKDNVIGRHFRLSPGKVQHAVREMNANRSHLDFVIHIGDTTDKDIEKNVPTIQQHLLRLQFPFFQVLGNHDFSSMNEGQRQHVPHFLGMPGRYYSLRAGEGHQFLVVVLDTTDLSMYATTDGTHRQEAAKVMANRYRKSVNGEPYNGGIGERQMRWLREQLDYATANRLLVLIFSHMPIYPYRTIHNLWNDVEVVQLLSQYPCVGAVFTGHTHFWRYSNIPINNGSMKFTLHFVSVGGIVQSPFISWGFLDVYKTELHVHGLDFGRPIEYHLKINSNTWGQVEKTSEMVSPPRKRNVVVVSRCLFEGYCYPSQMTTRDDFLDEYSNNPDQNPDFSFQMFFFSPMLILTAFCAFHWRRVCKRTRSLSIRQFGRAEPSSSSGDTEPKYTWSL